jgi:hypothetical protein
MQIYVEAMGDSHQMARIPGIKKWESEKLNSSEVFY